VNVTVENVGPCKRSLQIEVPVETIKAENEKVAVEYCRQARLPGFRPGKAPRKVVEKQYAGAILEETRKRVLNECFRKALEEQKLRLITKPEVKPEEFSPDKPFKFSATFEVEPEFELPQYKGLPAKVEDRKVTDEDVERALEVLQEQRAGYEDVERAVSSGDYVVVNYQGTCEGKPITEFNPAARGVTQKDDAWMLVETSHFIPGFTDQLLGANVGEKRTVKVSFPADFVIKEIAGKQGEYEVEVTGVKEKKLPPVDEEFAKSFGAESLEKLREGVRGDLANELEDKKRRSITDQLVANLLARFSCELPETLIQHETRNTVFDIVKSNADRGIPKEAMDEQKDQIYAVASNSAKERLRVRFAFERIAEAEKIEVSEQELSYRIVQMAAAYKMKPKDLVKQMQKNNSLGEVRYQVLSGKVIKFLEENARIETVPAGTLGTGQAPA
jgi:trigger factor